MSVVEDIVRSAQLSFTIAKRDGTLEVSEVIQIALDAAKKVYVLQHLSENEQDALVTLCLKKGLSAADGLRGLPAFAAVQGAALDALEAQVLQAGLTAVKMMRKNAPALFAPVKKLLARCLPACSLVSSVVKVLDPKDSAIVEEALQLVSQTADATQESVAPTSGNPPVVTPSDTPPQNTPDTEPTPLAA
jgi:hypothetical protein